MKINCDGAQKDLGCAGVDCVIRDSDGKWLIGSACKIERCSSLQAELLALIDGLELAWNEGHMFVKVEVDCLLALNLLKQEGKQVNVFSSFIRQILSLFGRD